ncbi:MAG: Na+/H+ antiporter subunit E [Gammaproteobacteria bacterium]
MKKIINLINHSLIPLVLLSALWAVIAKGSLSSWVVGMPCIIIAVIAYQRLRFHEKSVIHIGLLPGFTAWFLWHSLLGGMDVAWRALQLEVQLEPGFLRYRLTLPPGQARVFLVNVVSLLPGTLSADIEDDILVLHALEANSKATDEVREAELRISTLYGIEKD